MYSFGFSGGLRERRFSLKRTLSREVLQRARFIMYAHLALQATLFAYRTLFRFRYADPLVRVSVPVLEMPAPLPLLAVLPETVLLVRVSVPLKLKMPPPMTKPLLP